MFRKCGRGAEGGARKREGARKGSTRGSREGEGIGGRKEGGWRRNALIDFINPS